MMEGGRGIGGDIGSWREYSWMEQERKLKVRVLWARMLRCVAPGCGDGQEGDGDGLLSTLIQFIIRLLLRI